MRLEEVCTVFTDGDWIESKDQSDSGIRLVQTGNIGEGIYIEKGDRAKYISEETFSQLKCTEVFSGDILVSRLPEPVGRACVIPDRHERMITAVDCTICRVNDNLLSQEYLCYFMRSQAYYKQLLNHVTGTTRKRISRKNLGNIEVKIVSKEQQAIIVTTLDKLQSIITHRKQQLAKLDELVKARFVEMFGDPVLNEKGWKCKRLLDMGSCKNGMNFHYNDSGIEINCLGVGDFKDFSTINDTSLLPVVSLNEMPSEEYLLKNDDIVFVRSNGNKALVGRSVAVYPNDTPTTFSGFCIRYRLQDTSVSVPYLLRVLKSDDMRLKMAGRGANIQNLNQQILGTLIIPVPPIELQNQFAEFVKQIDKSKFIAEIIITTIRRVRLYDQF